MTHTRDEIMAMTVEELRIAIAKLKGYKDIFIAKPGDYVMDWRDYAKGGEVLYLAEYQTGMKYSAEVPDYPHDIAAAYELEESVPVNQHALYEQYLYVAIGKGIEWTFWDLIHATAEQKSRAWLIWSEESGK